MAKYGAGSVYRRERDGKWIGQWEAGRDAAGRRVRGSVTADSEAGAWKAMALARGSSSTRRRRAAGGETVGVFLARWLEGTVRTTRRERTLIGYRQIVANHLVPAFGDVPLATLDRRTVQSFVDRQTLAPLTVKHIIDCGKVAMSYAVRWGLRDTNPFTDLDMPRLARRSVRALSPDDARAIIAACEPTWFGPAVAVALWTGLRQGELLALRWEDVNLAGRTLTVTHSLARLPSPGGTRFVLDEPKTSRSRRTVPLTAPALAVLRAHRKASLGGNAHGLVFARPDGRPIDGTQLTHAFQAALEAAGLPRMTWHDLRHGFVSLLLGAGVPLPLVSELAGHSGIAITADVYGHLTAEAREGAMDRLAEVMG